MGCSHVESILRSNGCRVRRHFEVPASGKYTELGPIWSVKRSGFPRHRQARLLAALKSPLQDSSRASYQPSAFFGQSGVVTSSGKTRANGFERWSRVSRSATGSGTRVTGISTKRIFAFRLGRGSCYVGAARCRSGSRGSKPVHVTDTVFPGAPACSPTCICTAGGCGMPRRLRQPNVAPAGRR